MTILLSENVRCAVCGTKSKHTGLVSTNAFGYADLDTRPPEMKRSTMHAWVQRCPECRYCNSDISKLSGNAKHDIMLPAYQEMIRESERNNLATSFLCKSMLDEHGAQYPDSVWAAINAAWAFDDASDGESAEYARDRALSMILKAAANGQSFAKSTGAECAITVDLLRRAGHLKEAGARLQQQDRTGIEDIVHKVLDYQELLLQRADTNCHTVEEAIRDD